MIWTALGQASYGVAASAVADDAATDAAKIALKGGRVLVEMLMVVVISSSH